MRQTIADYLPPKIRFFLYVAIPTFVGLEAIWDFLPNKYEDKVLATLIIFGFGVAASQVPIQRRPVDPDYLEGAFRPADRGQATLGGIILITVVVLAVVFVLKQLGWI